jgi:hypothetical protein
VCGIGSEFVRLEKPGSGFLAMMFRCPVYSLVLSYPLYVTEPLSRGFIILLATFM